MKLVTSDQSKAQRHLFFAERAAKKVPDMPADAKPRGVDSVAVLGAGTMGRGIAMSFADSRHPGDDRGYVAKRRSPAAWQTSKTPIDRAQRAAG